MQQVLIILQTDGYIEGGSARIGSKMNPVYYFSNILALKSLYPTSKSHLQNPRERKGDRQLELTNSIHHLTV